MPRRNRERIEEVDVSEEEREAFLNSVRTWAHAVEQGRIKDAAPEETIEEKMKVVAERMGVIEEVRDILADARSPETTVEGEYEEGLSPGEDIDLTQYDPVVLTRSERKELNERAANLLQKERIELSDEDINVLRQYTGQGGLEAETTEEGVRQLNEHYTAYGLIEAMWGLLERHGFDSGPVLEPGSGIGNFAGFAPEDVRMLMVERSNISARIAEILYPNHEVINDSLSFVPWGRFNINGAVGNVPFGDYSIVPSDAPFPKSTRIHDYFILESIERSEPGSPILLVTSTGTMDKSDPTAKREMMKRAKFVDAWRLPSDMFQPNADTLVTTDLILLQKRPEPIEDTAGTIDEQFEGIVTREVERGDETYEVNLSKHFHENPDKALGRLEAGLNSQFVSQWGADGDREEAIETIRNVEVEFPHEFPEDQNLYVHDEGERIETDREYPNGAVVWFGTDGVFREKETMTWQEIEVEEEERVRSAVQLLDRFADYVRQVARGDEPSPTPVREAVDQHVQEYGLPAEDDAIQEALRYDPRLPKLQVLVQRDDEGNLEYADVLSHDTVYSDRYRSQLDSTTDLVALTTYLRAQGEPLTPESYAQVYDGGTATEDEVREAMVDHPSFYFNPAKQDYEFKYEYLAGNVLRKIDEAEEAGLDRNVEDLKDVMPDQASIFEIGLDPRHVSSYLDTEIVEQFIADEAGEFKRKVSVYVADEGKEDAPVRFYKVDTPRSASNKSRGWGHEPYSKLVHLYLNDKRISRKVVDEDGNLLGVKLSDASPEQKQRANRFASIWQERIEREIPRDFEQWVRTEASSEIREKIEEDYNRQFNARVNPTFDGSTFSVRGMSDTFDDMADFEIFEHNVRVAEKLLWHMGGGDFHDVGSGKTLASIITVMAAKQRGAVTKPMFVVPGQVLRKWQNEFVDLFPDAKTLVIELLGDREGTELARAQAQNWDAIFIPDSAFKRLPLSPDERAKRLKQRISDFEAQIDAAKRRARQEADAQQAKRVEKKLTKQLEELRTQVRDIQEGTEREEGDIYFDELGVDALVFDEAHLYKNALGTPLGQKLGIAKSASETSARAEDALQKARWIHDQNEGSNVWTLTATPVQNSPIEIWHMLNLCAPETLRKYDIQYLDDFIHLFVEKEQSTKKKVAGEYKREESITGYLNLPEMRRIIDEASEVKSYEQLQEFYDDNPGIASNFERPPHELKTEIIESTEFHELLFDDIEIRAEIVLDAMKSRKPGEDLPIKDNFLSLTLDGSKIATDLRVYDAEFVGEDLDMDRLKIERMFENVIRYYEGDAGATMGDEGERENPRSVAITPTNRSAAGMGVPIRDKERENPPPRNQIIFCDSITLKGKSAGSFSELMKQRLVELGVPEDEIVVATGSIMTLPDGNGGFSEQSVPSDRKQEAKRNIQERFNEGTHRILIGNSTVEEGMNLDKWGVAVHHLDIPYRPSRIQQRNGRMVRQGNQYGKVDVFFYLLRGSFDEYRLQLVQSKQGWIDELFYGEDRHAEGETGSRALSYEQMQAATAEDNRVEEFFRARQQLETLKQRISTLDSEVAQLQKSIEAAQEDVASKERSLEPTVEQERMIQAIEWDWTEPQDALDDGSIEVGDVQEKRFGSGYEIDVELSMTESRDFTGVSNIELGLDVPMNNPNGRIRWEINVREGRREFYGQKRQSGIFNYAKAELDSFLPSNGSLEWLEEQDSSRYIAEEDSFYEYYGIDNPSEDRGDRTYEEYKEDIGMNDIENWVPIIQRNLAALFYAAEHRWYRRSERREERTVEELEAAKENLETVETQLEQTESELEEAREDRQERSETVQELREVVNDIQQHEYPTRPALYERINEIAPKYGIEPPVEMHIVGEKEQYLSYISGWDPADDDEASTEVEAVTVETDGDSTPDTAADSEDPKRPPIVSDIFDLSEVIEAQTGESVDEKPSVDTIRRVLPELNVWIERGTGIPEYIVDTTQKNMWTKKPMFGDTGKKRLSNSRKDAWSNGAMIMFGDVGVSARQEFERQNDFDADPDTYKPLPVKKFEQVPDDARRLTVAGYSQGPSSIPLALRFEDVDDYALDFDLVGFALRHADIYDPEAIGEDVYFLKGEDDPKIYMMKEGSDHPKTTFMPIELGEEAPKDPRENPQLPLIRERQNPETEPLVFLGTSSLLRTGDRDIERNWMMFTRSEMDVLLLVPQSNVEVAEDAPDEVSDEREEWRHHPPKGVGMTVEVDYSDGETVPAPDRIEYESDKMIREQDDGEVHPYYHDFTDEHHTVEFSDGTILIGADVENGSIEESGSIEIDERGILN